MSAPAKKEDIEKIIYSLLLREHFLCPTSRRLQNCLPLNFVQLNCVNQRVDIKEFPHLLFSACIDRSDLTKERLALRIKSRNRILSYLGRYFFRNPGNEHDIGSGLHASGRVSK
jgi:hypothetical protein